MNRQAKYRRSAQAILAALALALPACTISSDNPPSDPERTKADAELLGTWEIPDPDPQAFCKALTIEKLSRPGYPAGAMKVTVVPRDPAERPIVAVCFSTELEGKKFAYCCTVAAEEAEHFPTWDHLRTKGYGIYKYEVRAKELTLWGGSTGLARAVEAGKLKGKWAGGPYYSYIRLTDTTANLAKFLSSAEGDAVFAKEGILKRVK